MPSKSFQSPVTAIKILSLQMETRKLNSEVEFVMVLAGKINVEKDGNVISMEQNDILMIRPSEFPVFSSQGSNLVMIITIKKDFFFKNGITSLEQFVCNSVDDREHDYTELRRILSRIAITHYEKSDSGNVHQIELCFSLVHYILSYHAKERKASQSSQVTINNRKTMIMDYLEENYMNHITLTDLADLTHLNSSYLSRFFRKATGGTFNNCLKNIRLSHALADLQETDKSITVVAYENGFSTPASFCNIFMAEYGITPSQYRRANFNGTSEKGMLPENLSVEDEEFQKIEAKLQSMANRINRSEADTQKISVSRNFVVENATLNTEFKPLWGKLINLGYCMNLLNSEFQSHLALLQEETGYEYGRIEGIINEDVLPVLPSGNYNFLEIDRIINTMIAHNIKPYIDLSIRGANTLLPGRDEIIYRHYDPRSVSQSFLGKIEAFVKHCVNFYGSNTVKEWIFDIGVFHDEHLSLKESPQAYAKRAKAGQDIIQKYISGATIGGLAYNAGMSMDIFENLISCINEEGFRPDFISTCVFPYEPVDLLNANLRLVSANPNHARNEILREKSILSKYPDITQSIWLAALGVSIQILDYVNDTCFQASYFIENTIELIHLVDVVGYYQLSDIADEYYGAARILYGASGIISRHGLKKPGFSALKRINRVDRRLLSVDSGFIATTNGVDTYHFVLCDYVYFNEVYCVSGGREMSVESAYDSFIDQGPESASIKIHGLKPGRYKLICESLNREHGSLFDEWMRYGILDDLQSRDIRYLRDVVHPHRFAQFIECEDGNMVIDTSIMPNEIKFYELVRII